MTRREAFEKANQEHEKRRKNENSNFNFNIEDLKYCGLDNEKELAVIRILGLPASSRESEFDAKIIQSSRIVGDDGKSFRCNWPDQKTRPDWILWKIYELVMSRTYNKESKSYTYHNQDKYPKVFERIFKNNETDPKKAKFESGWKPKKFVVMNVIDRLDPDWHKENKHSKLISKSEQYTFTAPGLPEYAYNAIWDNVVEYEGDWEEYDVVLRKLSADPWYQAYHPTNDRRKLEKDSPDILPFIVDGPLTEEELNYELYDLDKLFQITSYQKIYKKLKIFIEEIDKVFNKNFTKELEQLVEIEKKEFEEKYGKSSTSDADDSSTDESIPDTSTIKTAEEKEEVKPEPTPARASARKATSEEITLEDLKTKYGFKGIDKLTEQEKKWITGIKLVEGNPVLEYSPDAGALYDTEGFLSPEKFKHCPKSGLEFES